jgi:hypothetical protein
MIFITGFLLPTVCVHIEQFRKCPLYALPFEQNNLVDIIRHQQNQTTFKIVVFNQLFVCLTSP